MRRRLKQIIVKTPTLTIEDLIGKLEVRGIPITKQGDYQHHAIRHSRYDESADRSWQAGNDPITIQEKPIVLVSCSKTKQPFTCQAKSLYCSPLFKAQRAFAEAVSGKWFILSAKHGLIKPDDIIKPYDQTLAKMTLYDQKIWAIGVATILQKEITSDDL